MLLYSNRKKINKIKIPTKNQKKMVTPLYLATKSGAASLKIMKSPKNVIKIIIFSTIIVLLNYLSIKTQCGIGSSTLIEKSAIDISKAVLKNKHIIDFKASSGLTYSMELYLYAYEKNFINRLIFNAKNSNINLTKYDLYNSYKHMFLNFYIENPVLKKYLTQEIADRWLLSNVKVDQIVENLRYNAISMILTKAYLSEIAIEDNNIININNLPICEYLVSGGKTIQYLNTVVQIINEGQFIKLAESFNNNELIRNYISEENVINFFEKINVEKDCVSFINSVLGDLINLYDINKKVFVPKTNLVLHYFETKDKLSTVSKFIVDAGKDFKKEAILEKYEFNSIFKEIVKNKEEIKMIEDKKN